MQLQRALAHLPGVRDAGAVMGVAANKELLAQSGLLTDEADAAGPDDLVIVVQGDEAAVVDDAMRRIDPLLSRRREGDGNTTDDLSYRPKSLATAAQLAPDARWVLISTPGRYAAEVARTALGLGRHVLLYSDNVSIEDEIQIKQRAAAQGLLVMGPDCGTAIVNGIGLGFANAVRRGPIGLVGASGTGLQLVTVRIHQLGSGITHALGTGGRDLSARVGAITTLQCLDLLVRDPETRVVVLISKPPAAEIAARVLAIAQQSPKPVVINFIGYAPAHPPSGNAHFAATLDEAAELAVRLAAESRRPLLPTNAPDATGLPFASGQRYLRGLYSGGTLAYEAQLLLQDGLTVRSNAPLCKELALAHGAVSEEHTVVDLGEDEFTVGRLHPMLDHTLRIGRLLQEAADPTTALILLDVVLGFGAHDDPAGELGPAIAQARAAAHAAGRHLVVMAVVVGTEEDPQNLDRQIVQLRDAGAEVYTQHATAVRAARNLILLLERSSEAMPVALGAVNAPLQAINVGLESFAMSLTQQGAPVLQVEWRPPAAGNEKLMGILARMKAHTLG
jgi:FdrA protein